MKQKSMQEIITENHIKEYNKTIQRKAQLILTIIIALFIIMATITLLNKQYSSAVDKCSQKHDKSYCERVLA